MAVEVTDFAREVIEASYEKPVLVDFWAPWCGPCRMLGPVLEKLAEENESAWTLAKLNTDENPDVSMTYRIQSIPAVKLFINGEVADEFIGALPENQVRTWLEKSIPSEGKKQLEAAHVLIEAGQPEAAGSILSSVLATDPENPDARLLSAKLLVFSDPDAAEALTARTSGADAALVPLRDAVPAIARLMRLAQDPSSLPDGPGRETYATAIDALSRQDYSAALSAFMNVLVRDRAYDDDGARKACLALFALLGERHEAVRKHRRAFDMALF